MSKKPRVRKEPHRRKGRGRSKPASLTTTPGFAAFVVDQLSELASVTAKSMFGGVGLYSGGVFFGIVARDVLYFKTDDKTRPDYLRRGMKPFVPYDSKGAGTHRYYAVPIDVLESPPTLSEWALSAVAAAERSSR